ncbi:MAG: hypothetical protein CMJ48_06360 [Planctomycetaceae bacterium]|nr:hypothetical protein [Planctomycetaceae bacterium]
MTDPSSQRLCLPRKRSSRADRVRILAVVLVVVVGTLTPLRLWPLTGVLCCLVFVGHTLARVPMALLLRRLAVFLPALLLISVSVPLSQGFESGWRITASIISRGTLSFLSVLWLAHVVPFTRLLRALQDLRVPLVVIAILALMRRYLVVLWEELERMRRARQARSFTRTSLLKQWTTAIRLIAMLLIRSMARSERVYGAMCARGWDGTMRTLDANGGPDRE